MMASAHQHKDLALFASKLNVGLGLYEPTTFYIRIPDLFSLLFQLLLLHATYIFALLLRRGIFGRQRSKLGTPVPPSFPTLFIFPCQIGNNGVTWLEA